MIISHGRRYIFVHAPKTGGTALALALEARAMKDDILIGDTPKARQRRRRLKGVESSGRLWKHSRLADIYGLVGQEDWRVYMSFDGDRPAGCGAMRIHDGVAWLDWAATLPEFRRRGSQGAILARRVADARELGCDLLLTATGVAKEGDPQHSYRNIERAGFRLSHVRDNWSPKG